MLRTLKRKTALALCLILLVSVCGVSALADGFDGSHWGADTVSRLIDEGIIPASMGGTHTYNTQITRYEFVTLINRTFGFTSTNGAVSFTDIAANSSQKAQLDIASAQGYYQGTGTADKPVASADEKLTREQAFVMLARVLGVDRSAKSTSYSDNAAISSWAVGSIAGMTKAGYLQGRSDGKADPKANLTVAEIAAAISNTFAKRVTKAGDVNLGSVSGNVLVTADGVNITGGTVKANLYITEGVGDGNVSLKKVRVDGDLIVRGGGMNSVSIIDSTISTMQVDKTDGKVRIVVSSTTKVSDMRLASGTTVVASELSGGKIDFTTIPADANGQPVTLTGSFENIVNYSKNADISITGSVENFYSTEPATLSGTVTIANAVLTKETLSQKGKDVTIKKETVATASEVSKKIEEKTREASTAQPEVTPSLAPTGGNNGNNGGIGNAIPPKFTIKFDKNGGDTDAVPSTISDLTVTSATNTLRQLQYIPSVKLPTKKGYSFTGWNIKPDGTGEVIITDISNLSSRSSGGYQITVYAQWRRNGELPSITCGGTVVVDKKHTITDKIVRVYFGSGIRGVDPLSENKITSIVRADTGAIIDPVTDWTLSGTVLTLTHQFLSQFTEVGIYTLIVTFDNADDDEENNNENPTDATTDAITIIVQDSTVSPSKITGATVNIVAPITGAASVNTTGGMSCIGVIVWKAGTTTLSIGDKFLGDTAYTAEVTLRPSGATEFGTPFNLIVPDTLPAPSNIKVSKGSVTFTVSFPATAEKAVANIVVKTSPAKALDSYKDGGALALDGLVVTLKYNDGTTADVDYAYFAANNLITAPVNGDSLTLADSGKPIVITHTDGGGKAITDNLTVTESEP